MSIEIPLSEKEQSHLLEVMDGLLKNPLLGMERGYTAVPRVDWAIACEIAGLPWTGFWLALDGPQGQRFRLRCNALLEPETSKAREEARGMMVAQMKTGAIPNNMVGAAKAILGHKVLHVHSGSVKVTPGPAEQRPLDPRQEALQSALTKTLPGPSGASPPPREAEVPFDGEA